MSKLVTYVGFSRVQDELKFRTATDEKRIFQLEKLGDTDVNMTALPQPMTKSEAAKWALTAEFFTKNPNVGADVEALFVANVKDENPFAKVSKPKATKPATVKVTKKVAPQIQMDVIGFNSVKASKIRAEFMKKLKAVYDAN